MKTCPNCGILMNECFFTQGILPLGPQISINDGSYSPNVYNVQAYVCPGCGKIEFYCNNYTVGE